MLGLRSLYRVQFPFVLIVLLGSPFCSSALAQSEPDAILSPDPNVEAVGFSNPSYVLGAGDQIDLTVFDYEEYTGRLVILPDGSITLPLIGRVQASDKTIEELDQDLTVRLQSYLVNPVVNIALAIPRAVEVNISGEVGRPGPVRSDAFQGNPTLSEALLAAGGITQNADIRQVELQRYDPQGNSQPIVINLWDAISSDNPPPDLILQDGDSIYVPRLASGETLDRRLVARSSFAPETVRVRVVGEVTQPGEVELPPDSSISSAIAIAGGPTGDARLSRVGFVRMNEDGRIERQTVDLSELTDNYQVQEGDVIVVPERNTSSILDFAGRVFSPINALLNLIYGVERLTPR